LYSFVGTPRYEVTGPHVRGPRSLKAWSTLIERGGDRVFIGLPDGPYERIYRRSVFVLCPAGFARWSFRVTEAISCGAIPVILSDYYVKPFASRVPWDEFSITIPESDLTEVDTILGSLSPARVRAFQDRLERAQAAFTPDGLRDLLIDGLRSRIA
jgi:xylogalacturonan beta-1,3-xylosyltransferase